MKRRMYMIAPFFAKLLYSSQIKIYKSADGLKDFLDKDHIPSDFGGKDKSLEDLAGELSLNEIMSLPQMRTNERFALLFSTLRSRLANLREIFARAGRTLRG